MSSAQPKQLISCYDDLGFEQHEWGKHGVCAGVKDAKDFFTQVCALSAAPLSVMAATENSCNPTVPRAGASSRVASTDTVDAPSAGETKPVTFTRLVPAFMSCSNARQTGLRVPWTVIMLTCTHTHTHAHAHTHTQTHTHS